MKKIIPYNPTLKDKARYLRNNSTLSEVLLWNLLKKKQLLGYGFHRQKPIDEYIVDFFCNDLMLVIEIDGISHDGKYNYDVKRQKRLEQLKLKVLRFRDSDVKNNLESVVQSIKDWIIDNNPPRSDSVSDHPS